MQPALSTNANSGFPAGAKRADDITPEAWTGLIGGLMEFLGEEAREPEHAEDESPKAAGIMFEDPNGNVLLLRRSASGDHPNEWGFPAGHVEGAETAEEAARREAREEVGDVPAGEMSLLDKGDGSFHTFKQNVQDQFEPKLNHEHTGHVWASKDAMPEPLHPGVARLMGAMGKGADGMPLGGKESPFDPPVVPDPDGVDGMPIKGGGQSPFDPGTSPKVNLDDEYHRDARGEFASEGSESGSGTSRREREDFAGRRAAGEGSGPGGSGWAANELADYADEKPEGVAAADASREAEHTATIKFNGDFDMAGLVKHLHHLGAIGASRGVEAIDEDDKPVRFGWDGDGADKIVEAQIDGKDVLAQDEWARAIDIATDWALKMALDRESVRSIDHDGRLHIEVANICKANVCPYKGDEIPGWEELGLDPDRIYRLLRDPDELEKALPSANSLQILKRHVPVNADDHQPWETVGATGSTATWATPCIQNSLVIWAKDAIDDIESGDKRELSPGYHYKPDLTPGSYQGEAYDGVMREIRFNHLALVETGRQGSDVVIGDNDDVLWGLAERAILEYLQDA
jgi:8-oxo-dGTP pyrophosphatase MutT (NUDIX family)